MESWFPFWHAGSTCSSRLRCGCAIVGVMAVLSFTANAQLQSSWPPPNLHQEFSRTSKVGRIFFEAPCPASTTADPNLADPPAAAAAAFAALRPGTLGILANTDVRWVPRGEWVGLLRFLAAMPKGGDLHSHLMGVADAKSYLSWAAERSLCAELKHTNAGIPFTKLLNPPCGPSVAALLDDAAGNATAAVRVAALADGLSADGLSTTGFFRQHPNHRPHRRQQHFFDMFSARAPAAAGRQPEMLAEAMARAAAQNTWYLELMVMTGMARARTLAGSIPWSDDVKSVAANLPAAKLDAAVADAVAELDTLERSARRLLGCPAAPVAPGRAVDAAPAVCGVTVRYVGQVSRIVPAVQVFAQTLVAFKMAEADSRRFVGVNIVAPEHYPKALADYSRHMAIFGFCRRLMPSVHVSLHAGELTRERLLRAGHHGHKRGRGQSSTLSHLGQHVGEAVRVGTADRIGHGVDILEGTGSAELMAEMAARGVAVEICLSSNDFLLGVAGARHPFSAYLAAGVPTVLSTDDEGILRTNLTVEFARAAVEHGLGYLALKRLARNSLEFSFALGASLWRPKERGTHRELATPCARDRPAAVAAAAAAMVSRPCADFLAQSDKAALQWKLEHDFVVFERAFLTLPCLGT